MFEVHIMSARKITIFHLQTTGTISSEQNVHENVILQFQWYLICKLSHETFKAGNCLLYENTKKRSKIGVIINTAYASSLGLVN